VLSSVHIGCLRLLLILIVAFLPLYSHGADKTIINIVLNGENKGDFFLILTSEGRMLFSPDDLLAMGFKAPPEGAEAGREGYLALDVLSPRINLQFDEMAATIHLTAEPQLLKKTSVDLSARPPDIAVFTADDSAFLNYGLTYSTGDASDQTSLLTVPLEMGIYRSGYLGISTFSYLKNDADDRFVRLLSSISRDDPAGLRRFVLGDFPAFSGILGSGGILGGLSISTNYAMNPFLVRSPGLDLHGVAQAPSKVDVYVNGLFVHGDRLPPGEFEFLNLSPRSGAGEMMLVIKDDFGLEQSIYFPYYGSSMLLSPGLQEYSYNLGFKRRELGKESFAYDDLALALFHRVGITSTLTGGLRAEAARRMVNAGPTASFLVGNYGEFDTSLALSQGESRFGYGYFARYLYSSRYISGSITLRGLSREYANLTLSPGSDKPRLESSFNLGFRNPLLGSLSLNYRVSDLYEEKDLKSAALLYSRRLLESMSLYVRVSRTDADSRMDEFFAGLNFLLGKKASGNLSLGMQDSSAIVTAAVQQSPPLGSGFGYRLLAEKKAADQSDSNSTRGNASIQYRGSYGIYSADYWRTGGQDTYTLSTSGGVAFIHDSFYLSRPITDGFALVKVGDLENVRVRLNNQEVGVTDQGGEVLVPGLVSYHHNHISIDHSDIPINYAIAEIKRLVSVPHRGGGIAHFDLLKLQGFTGRIFLLENGQRTAAEYWGFEIKIDGDVMKGVVGKKGDFYLENIQAGKFPARVFMNDRECLFKLAIPDSEEILVEMGEVFCEMD
jgi:outer membrane usher protein